MNNAEVRKFDAREEAEMTALGFKHDGGDFKPWRAPTKFGCDLRAEPGIGTHNVARVFCDFDRPVGPAGEETYADIADRLGNVNRHSGKCNEYCDGAETADEAWKIIRAHLLRCTTTATRPRCRLCGRTVAVENDPRFGVDLCGKCRVGLRKKDAKKLAEVLSGRPSGNVLPETT